jgi:hypothetical protein
MDHSGQFGEYQEADTMPCEYRGVSCSRRLLPSCTVFHNAYHTY